MPDGDVFTRSVAPRWRHLASALRDDLPVDECTLRLEDGLAKGLRKSGGLTDPGLRHAMDAGTASEADVLLALKRLVSAEVFERVMPLLVAQDRFPTYDAAQKFVNFCLDRARLDVIARSIIRRPDATDLRRPPRRRSVAADLLSEPAPLGVRA